MTNDSPSMRRARDPLARQRVPAPPAELAARVLAAAAAAASRNRREDWAARLWASTTARMLWATTICVLVFGHTLVSRPLPLASSADGVSQVRAVAALLELPPQSVAIMGAAVRRHFVQGGSRASIVRGSGIEELIEETGG